MKAKTVDKILKAVESNGASEPHNFQTMTREKAKAALKRLVLKCVPSFDDYGCRYDDWSEGYLECREAIFEKIEELFK